MYKAHDVNNVIECCSNDDTLAQILPYLLEQLEICQKSLSSYLETKRALFPRFFFISDPVLLEILGQSSKPQSIEPHLLSLFDAVSKVEFDSKTTNTIIGIYSELGEYLCLDTKVQCVGGVEVWLGVLLNAILESVATTIGQMAQNLQNKEFDFISEFQKFCAQVFYELNSKGPFLHFFLFRH